MDSVVRNVRGQAGAPIEGQVLFNSMKIHALKRARLNASTFSLLVLWFLGGGRALTEGQFLVVQVLHDGRQLLY